MNGIRRVLTVGLLVFAFAETGFFTALALGLLFAERELSCCYPRGDA